ncbi:MAG TPA: NUDIX domain-containing protein [Trebonia sp.]|nr:NUDIX domain-containing protein [Trebonia sp.]
MIPTITGLRKQQFQMDFFDEGTIPGNYISPGENLGWTPNQLQIWQDQNNALAGDPAWKHKSIALPPGSKVFPMKPIEIADQSDEVIMTQICMGYDVEPMELGISPKVSATQSPGASNQMAKASQDKQQRKSTKPTLSFLTDIFNVLIQVIWKQEDMRFMFEGLEEDEDEDSLVDRLVKMLSNGLAPIDECRIALGKPPYGLPITSDPVFVSPTAGMVPLGSIDPTTGKPMGTPPPAAIGAPPPPGGGAPGGPPQVPGAAGRPALPSGSATPPKPGTTPPGAAGAPKPGGPPGTAPGGPPAGPADAFGKPLKPGDPGTDPQHPAPPPKLHPDDKVGQARQSAQEAHAQVQQQMHEDFAAGKPLAPPVRPPSASDELPGSEQNQPARPSTKAMLSELDALRRKVKKGTRVEDWQSRHLPEPVVEHYGELLKSLDADDAYRVTRQFVIGCFGPPTIAGRIEKVLSTTVPLDSQDGQQGLAPYDLMGGQGGLTTSVGRQRQHRGEQPIQQSYRSGPHDFTDDGDGNCRYCPRGEAAHDGHQHDNGATVDQNQKSRAAVLPKAGRPTTAYPRDWAGWRYDLQLKDLYADRLSAGLAALHSNMAEDWLQSRTATANKGALSNLAQQAWSWLTSRGFDQAIQDVVQQVLGNLWAEGFAVGREAAREQLSSAYDSTFWDEWTPGDAAAARLVAGNGLQQLLDDYGIQTIKSVTQTRMTDLANALAEGFEDGDSADTIAADIKQILSNPQRALMVAGTELARATTQASVAEYRKADQDAKKWSSAKDDRVCPHCKLNVDQGVIPIDQVYDTGDTFPPGHPECRCAILPKRLPVESTTVAPMSVAKSLVLEEYLASGLTYRDFERHELGKVGPHGYEHGWVFVGVPGAGSGGGAKLTKPEDWAPHLAELQELDKLPLDNEHNPVDPVLKRMLEIQGFNAKPGHDPIDPDRPVHYHAFGDWLGHSGSEGGGASDYADQFVNGDFRTSTGGRTAGFYTANHETGPSGAAIYTPHVMPMQFKPGSKVESADDLEDAAMQLPEPYKSLVRYDAGRMAALTGVDGVSEGKARTVVINRGALNVGPIRDTRQPKMAGWPKTVVPRYEPMRNVFKSDAAEFEAGGLAVRAKDTGRVLMIQRAHDEDDPAGGKWEFPGGRLEDGESVEDAARREWAEETGLPVPKGNAVATWDTGPYRGHVVVVRSESDVPILDRAKGANPDDPGNDNPEAVAWWDPAELKDNPAVRDELRDHPKRVRRALEATGDPIEKSAASIGEQVYQQLLRNYPPDSIEWVKDATWSGPHLVPWAEVDHDDMDKWAASHQRGKVDEFKRKIRAGEHVNPAVLVVDPDGDYIDVDGHHRALAYHELDELIPAWIGDIEPADRHDMEETHLDQVHEGSDPKNKHAIPRLIKDSFHGHHIAGTAYTYHHGYVLIDPAANDCHDGCGGKTKGGNYLPGHDAKHVSHLHQAVQDGHITAESALGMLHGKPKLQGKLETKLNNSGHPVSPFYHSTADYDAHANHTFDPNPAPAKPKIEPGHCHDGCGAKTKGGNYLPGHDSKHVSQLVASVKNGDITHAQAHEELSHSAKLQDKLASKLGTAKPKPTAPAAATHPAPGETSDEHLADLAAALENSDEPGGGKPEGSTAGVAYTDVGVTPDGRNWAYVVTTDGKDSMFAIEPHPEGKPGLRNAGLRAVYKGDGKVTIEAKQPDGTFAPAGPMADTTIASLNSSNVKVYNLIGEHMQGAQKQEKVEFDAAAIVAELSTKPGAVPSKPKVPKPTAASTNAPKVPKPEPGAPASHEMGAWDSKDESHTAIRDALFNEDLPGHPYSANDAVAHKQLVASRLAARIQVEPKKMVAAAFAGDGNEDTEHYNLMMDAAEHPDKYTFKKSNIGYELTISKKNALNPLSDYDKQLTAADIKQWAAAKLVQNWAGTSNDTSTKSLVAQEAAIDEFGLDRGHVAPWTLDSGKQDEIDEAYAQHGEAYRAFLRAQYELTQEDFKERGITRVNVIRGMKWDAGMLPDWAKGIKSGDKIEVPPLRPLSSWTVNTGTAKSFANGGSTSVILKSSMPVTSILSWPRSGFGCLNEYELVGLDATGVVTVGPTSNT